MAELATVLNLINYIFVLIFGIVVSFYFADIPWEDNKKLHIYTLMGFILLQAVCYMLLGEHTLYKSYPFLIHIPLILVIRFICHRNIYISSIAVLSAYLMCTPRKWFGTVAAYIFNDIPMISDITTIIVTIPLILVVILYLILSIVTLTLSNKKNTAERENIILLSAAAQAEKEIEQLSDYQRQAAIYRHDLRHHMNFIQSCLNNNNYTQAQEYISEICTNLDNSRITKYCDNEAVNLILSSYIGKANEHNITTHISVTAANLADYKPTDLCSLFANALENAINACRLVQTISKNDYNSYNGMTVNNSTDYNSANSNRIITVKVFDKNNKLCINITNTYAVEPIFVNNTPVSDKAGHGIGVRSIISVIEKYNGVYDFFTKDGVFYFQACM